MQNDWKQNESLFLQLQVLSLILTQHFFPKCMLIFSGGQISSYLKTLLSLKTETEDVRQKLFPSLKVSRMSRLRSLVYTVTSVLDNRSGTSVQVQVHWYVRLKAERITTSAEQIISLIFTEHFFLQIYQICSSEKMFCENCFIQFVLQRPLQRCSHSVTGLLPGRLRHSRHWILCTPGSQGAIEILLVCTGRFYYF